MECQRSTCNDCIAFRLQHFTAHVKASTANEMSILFIYTRMHFFHFLISFLNRNISESKWCTNFSIFCRRLLITFKYLCEHIKCSMLLIFFFSHTSSTFRMLAECVDACSSFKWRNRSKKAGMWVKYMASTETETQTHALHTGQSTLHSAHVTLSIFYSFQVHGNQKGKKTSPPTATTTSEVAVENRLWWHTLHTAHYT